MCSVVNNEFNGNQPRKEIKFRENEVVMNGRSFHVRSLETEMEIIENPRLASYNKPIQRILEQLSSNNNVLRGNLQKATLRKIVIKQGSNKDTVAATHLTYKLVFDDNGNKSSIKGAIPLAPGEIHEIPKQLELEVDETMQNPHSTGPILELHHAESTLLTTEEKAALQAQFKTEYANIHAKVMAQLPPAQQQVQDEIDKIEQIPLQDRTEGMKKLYCKSKNKLKILQSTDGDAINQYTLANKQIVEGMELIKRAKMDAADLKETQKKIKEGLAKLAAGHALLAFYKGFTDSLNSSEKHSIKLSNEEQRITNLTAMEHALFQDEFRQLYVGRRTMWEDGQNDMQKKYYTYEKIPVLARSPAEHARFWQLKHRLARPQALHHSAMKQRELGKQLVESGLKEISAAKQAINIAFAEISHSKEVIENLKPRLGDFEKLLTDSEKMQLFKSFEQALSDPEKKRLVDARDKLLNAKIALDKAEKELKSGLKDLGMGKAYLALYTPTEDQIREWDMTRKKYAIEARAAYATGGLKETILASSGLSPIAYAMLYSNRLLTLKKNNPKEKVSWKIAKIWAKSLIAPVIRPLQTLHLTTVGAKGFQEEQVDESSRFARLNARVLYAFTLLTVDADFAQIDKTLHDQVLKREELAREIKARQEKAIERKRAKVEVFPLPQHAESMPITEVTHSSESTDSEDQTEVESVQSTEQTEEEGMAESETDATSSTI